MAYNTIGTFTKITVDHLQAATKNKFTDKTCRSRLIVVKPNLIADSGEGYPCATGLSYGIVGRFELAIITVFGM